MKQIVFSQDVCGGEPRIDTTRLSCGAVVWALHFGQLTLDEYLQTYPYLAAAEVKNCLSYCAKRQCVADQPFNFCHSCSLDKRAEDSPAGFITRLKDPAALVPKERGYIFAGTVGEYLDEEVRQNYWELSSALLRKFFDPE